MLEGFVVWLDIFFLTSHGASLAKELRVSDARQLGTMSFSTGPEAATTHSQHGVLLLLEKPRTQRTPGSTLEGRVAYSGRNDSDRNLQIRTSWRVGDQQGFSTQAWTLD